MSDLNFLRKLGYDHPLAAAARELDSLAEEHGLEAVARRLGMEAAQLWYFAEQRALRSFLVITGQLELLNRLGADTSMHANVQQVPGISAADQQVIRHLAMSELDGIVHGWRGREIQELRERQQ